VGIGNFSSTATKYSTTCGLVVHCPHPGESFGIESMTATDKQTIGDTILYLCSDGKMDYRTRRQLLR